eukprot:TRINITY_DN15955_c0_g1_i1.p1 TRINITY_DN15955_c0_g1~~TRINITY_DN15955_c0_g1_i1.p1  ORF type:complete len:573 (+),score=96.75 TRINITY_DN15955_c0_g1_i1:114-1721(+)
MAPTHSKLEARRSSVASPQDAAKLVLDTVGPSLRTLFTIMEEGVETSAEMVAAVAEELNKAAQKSGIFVDRVCGAVARFSLGQFIFGDAPLAGSLPVLFVLQIIALLYNAFVMVYMPAAGIAFNSPTSLMFHAIVFMSLVGYYRAMSTDPGTVPDTPEWKTFARQAGEQKTSGGSAKWCKKANCYKPDRAHSCGVMGHLVLRMDHHCPWLGNTVGWGNHKFFFLFLLYVNAACSWLGVSLLKLLLHVTMPPLTTFLVIGAESLTMLLLSVLMPFFLFHCYLLVSNMTTIEFCEQWAQKKGEQKEGAQAGWAYDMGVFANISSVMGSNPLLWFLPVGGPQGDGMHFPRKDDSKPAEGAKPGSSASSRPAEAASGEDLESGARLSETRRACKLASAVDEPKSASPRAASTASSFSATSFVASLWKPSPPVQQDAAEDAESFMLPEQAPSTKDASRGRGERPSVVDEFRRTSVFWGESVRSSMGHLQNLVKADTQNKRQSRRISTTVAGLPPGFAGNSKKKVKKASVSSSAGSSSTGI